MALTPVTAPASEPLDVGLAKAHLRIEASVTDDDSYIAALIAAARRRYEAYSKRAVITQSWDWTRDHFPPSGWVFEVPKPALQSVTSITYTDSAGAAQTLATAEYTVDAKSEPGRIAEAFGKTWPAAQAVINAVTVRFAAGFGADANAVPENVKLGMQLLIGTWYRNRESVITGTTAAALPDGIAALWGSPGQVSRF